jgi:hypothetical protein
MVWLLVALLLGAVAFRIAGKAREIPRNSVFTRRRSVEK